MSKHHILVTLIQDDKHSRYSEEELLEKVQYALEEDLDHAGVMVEGIESVYPKSGLDHLKDRTDRTFEELGAPRLISTAAHYKSR